MPFYNRSELLKETLRSYVDLYKHRTDYECLIIEDYKSQIDADQHKALMDVISMYSEQLHIKHLLRPEEFTYNPCLHFNQGVESSDGLYLILTNPECAHRSPILDQLDALFMQNQNNYIVCSCFDEHNEIYWLQHSVHNNRKLHFCAAIRKTVFNDIGGFDDNYRFGVAFDDNDFINKIMNTTLNIVTDDSLLVEHLSHEDYPDKYGYLFHLNKNYYENKWDTKYMDETIFTKQPNKLKVYIINYNLLTWTRDMVNQLMKWHDCEPVIVDNASSYEPLINWYETECPCRVIKMDKNYGHMVFWERGIIDEVEDLYVVTDPDLDISTVPRHTINKLKYILDKHKDLSKAGLHISFETRPEHYYYRDMVINAGEREKDLWNSDIDTTFALYSKKRGFPNGFFKSLRVGGIYTCKHIPYHIDPNNITEEYKYYLKYANVSSTIATYGHLKDSV